MTQQISRTDLKSSIQLPFILKTSLTCITVETSQTQAAIWLQEVEKLYDDFYSSHGFIWVWEDTHKKDFEAMMELETILAANAKFPLDESLIHGFVDTKWRKEYSHNIGFAKQGSPAAVKAGFPLGCFVYSFGSAMKAASSYDTILEIAAKEGTVPSSWSMDHPDNADQLEAMIGAVAVSS